MVAIVVIMTSGSLESMLKAMVAIVVIMPA